jgi:hypothetical protein
VRASLGETEGGPLRVLHAGRDGAERVLAWTLAVLRRKAAREQASAPRGALPRHQAAGVPSPFHPGGSSIGVLEGALLFQWWLTVKTIDS